MIECELNYQREHQMQKEATLKDPSFSASKAFSLITQNRSVYIDDSILDEFLCANSIHHSLEDVIGFIRRMDLDHDGKLCFKEFVEAFTTSSPSKKSTATSYVDKPITTEISPNKNATSNLYSTPSKSSKADYLYTSPITSDYKFNVGISPSKSTDDKLIDAFKEQIETEKDLEFHKGKLSLKVDFNLIDVFKQLDIEGKGWLSKYDLQMSLKILGIYSTLDEIYLFFKRYDTDNDGKLKHSDIQDAFVPKQKEYFILLINRVPMKYCVSNKNARFTPETMALFKITLEKLIKCELTNERLRQRLSLNPSFDFYNAFKSCDINKEGYLTLNGLREFLQAHGLYKSDSDIGMLISKYDANKDGKVSYTEFANEMQPKSPKKL